MNKLSRVPVYKKNVCCGFLCFFVLWLVEIGKMTAQVPLPRLGIPPISLLFGESARSRLVWRSGLAFCSCKCFAFLWASTRDREMVGPRHLMVTTCHVYTMHMSFRRKP
ncbi:hypothetical protein QBC35DRAFT_493261 [Podospora australis]|uniref:Uncharacterized protein n=1 Tax=Podospora australis TaxID=1536484 RepID=A0AAN6WXG6_9PEZI|nr:hypothetical protein QBC35DRAFT_493261 [Podospora australis]